MRQTWNDEANASVNKTGLIAISEEISWLDKLCCFLHSEVLLGHAAKGLNKYIGIRQQGVSLLTCATSMFVRRIVSASDFSLRGCFTMASLLTRSAPKMSSKLTTSAQLLGTSGYEIKRNIGANQRGLLIHPISDLARAQTSIFDYICNKSKSCWFLENGLILVEFEEVHIEISVLRLQPIKRKLILPSGPEHASMKAPCWSVTLWGTSSK